MNAKHTSILWQQQNLISGYDKMLVWSDIFVINCRWGKISLWLSAWSDVHDKLSHDDMSWPYLSKLLSDSSLDYECFTSAKVTVSVEEQLCIGISVITKLYLQLYITYQLCVSAISDLASIRLDTIIRETI